METFALIIGGLVLGAYLTKNTPLIGGVVFGIIMTTIFVSKFDSFPLEYIGIHLNSKWEVLDFFTFSIIVYILASIFKSSNDKKVKTEEDKHNQRLYDSPVEILSFGSRNNIFTAGNNTVRFKARNNSDNAILFTVDLKYGSQWKTHWEEFEIDPRKIEEFSILGKAWNRAEDIRVSSWR